MAQGAERLVVAFNVELAAGRGERVSQEPPPKVGNVSLVDLALLEPAQVVAGRELWGKGSEG